MNSVQRISLAVVAACTLITSLAAQSALPAISRWKRASDTPIVSPQGDGWESAGTFNPSVVFFHGKFVMLYRAQDRAGTSRLGYAESTDGIHFHSRSQPVFSPQMDYEKNGGVEDPRLVKFGRTFYLTYTGYNKRDAQLCLATSKDLVHWKRRGVILPAYKGKWYQGWTKSGAIVPEKIDGKYWMYFHGISTKIGQVGLAYSTDLVHWTEALGQPILPVRPGNFDSTVVEPGPAPILTPSSIILLYNGADDHLVYRTGFAVFDRKDPSHLLMRSSDPIFAPDKDWEKIGQVPNVVFVEGAAPQGDHYLFYYGGADKYVGVAQADVSTGAP
ncbi:MAG TPA: glycoside hydrolase family 130 protein [Terriglobales bacterium]|nr:glycoside hydrolase family 130 protein [Terriglobales bacterium]